jgi:hypothetical protein
MSKNADNVLGKMLFCQILSQNIEISADSKVFSLNSY